MRVDGETLTRWSVSIADSHKSQTRIGVVNQHYNKQLYARMHYSHHPCTYPSAHSHSLAFHFFFSRSHFTLDHDRRLLNGVSRTLRRGGCNRAVFPVSFVSLYLYHPLFHSLIHLPSFHSFVSRFVLIVLTVNESRSSTVGFSLTRFSSHSLPHSLFQRLSIRRSSSPRHTHTIVVRISKY